MGLEIGEDIDTGLERLGWPVVGVEVEEAPVRGIGVNAGDLGLGKGAKGGQRHDRGTPREVGHQLGRAVVPEKLAAGVECGLRGIGIDREGSVHRDLPGVQDGLQVLAAVVFLPGGEKDHPLWLVLQDGQEVLHGLAADEADHNGRAVGRHDALLPSKRVMVKDHQVTDHRRAVDESPGLAVQGVGHLQVEP